MNHTVERDGDARGAAYVDVCTSKIHEIMLIG